MAPCPKALPPVPSNEHGEECVCHNHGQPAQKLRVPKCKECGGRHEAKSPDASPVHEGRAATPFRPDMELVSPAVRAASPFQGPVVAAFPSPGMPPAVPAMVGQGWYHPCPHAWYEWPRVVPQVAWVPVQAMGVPVVHHQPVNVNVQQNFIMCPHCASAPYGRR